MTADTRPMQLARTEVDLPDSTLIICSRNRPQMLSETIDSILSGTSVPTELVVIDQSSVAHPDLSSRVTDRRCRIRYVPTRSVGLGRARNAGLAVASHDLIAFIDDDMYVGADWYRALIGNLAQAGPGAVITGQVLIAEDGTPDGFAPSITANETPAVYSGRVGRDVLSAGNMAMYRSAVDRVGPFDDQLGAGSHFPSSEDNDFGFRLLEAGLSIQYMPEAVVYHRAWRPRKGFAALQWRYGRGQGAFYAKHFHGRDWYMQGRLSKDAWHYVTQMPRRLWRRQPDRALGDVAFVLGMLSGAMEWLLTQRAMR